MRFDIRPNEGAYPITIGMHRDQVHAVLGPPKYSRPTWDKKGFGERWPALGCNIGYDLQWAVTEVIFYAGVEEVALNGRLFWHGGSTPDPNPVFLELDPSPVEHVGFWLFLKVGISTTGFHDDDPPQQAVHVWPKGSRDDFLNRAKPADSSRYQSHPGQS